MIKHEFVEREISHGCIGGWDYSSPIPVIARSPTHILYHGRGAQIWRRDDYTGRSRVFLFRERGTPTRYAEKPVQEQITAIFGVGSGQLIIQAIKGRKTIIFDGDEHPLPMPAHMIREKAEKAYETKNINWKADLTGKIGVCRQCGGNLVPVLKTHVIDRSETIISLEECQLRSNYQVVEIADYGALDHKLYGRVNYFRTWDGETVEDPYFCSDQCAIDFAHRIIKEELVPVVRPRFLG